MIFCTRTHRRTDRQTDTRARAQKGKEKRGGGGEENLVAKRKPEQPASAAAEDAQTESGGGRTDRRTRVASTCLRGRPRAHRHRPPVTTVRARAEQSARTTRHAPGPGCPAVPPSVPGDSGPHGHANFAKSFSGKRLLGGWEAPSRRGRRCRQKAKPGGHRKTPGATEARPDAPDCSLVLSEPERARRGWSPLGAPTRLDRRLGWCATQPPGRGCSQGLGIRPGSGLGPAAAAPPATEPGGPCG